MSNPIILDGKTLADKICADLKRRVEVLHAGGYNPKLTIVTTGDDSASKVYVNNKIRRAKEIGIDVEVMHYDQLTSFDYSLTMGIRTPIIYQLPLTGTITENIVAITIDPKVDVDGFNRVNQYGLLTNTKSYHQPCTPKGIMRLLDEYDIDISGKHVCIIGRSNIVGKPLACMMENKDATVTLCHSKTPGPLLYETIKNADIVVSAVGKCNFINCAKANVVSHWSIDWTNKILIDVAINRDENGKLCGDIDKNILECSKAYTPVPGGVGPMTVAMLMENVIEGYEKGYYERY